MHERSIIPVAVMILASALVHEVIENLVIEALARLVADVDSCAAYPRSIHVRSNSRVDAKPYQVSLRALPLFCQMTDCQS